MTRRGGAFIGLTAVVSFLIGLVVAGTRPPAPTTALPVPRDAGSLRPITIASHAVVEHPKAAGGLVDFGAVAERLNAAVVNVDTAARPTGGDAPRSARRLGRGDQGNAREGSGSGFIIDPAGYILTNHHVISGADRVTVTLSDGRFFRADVIGVDPAIDVALLRVHASSPLPAASLGDSDALRVGEWVCAIGNPLGVYTHSVTVGVISFLGRKLFDGLDAYIQTDAAISFGNSGGPLINARGQVVGITTAISAQASNIGFAVPINQVVAVLPQLREHGMVSRGYIGVSLTSLTPALKRALQIAPDAGALVEDVTPDTPAERAGLRPYDVIVGADGQAIESDEDLTRHVAGRQPGTLTSLEVWRDGEIKRVFVKLRDRPLPRSVSRRTIPGDVQSAVQPLSPLGIRVRELDQPTASRLNIPDTVRGVLIADVDPTGPARLAQVRANQVVLEINRRRVGSMQEYHAALGALEPGQPAVLLLFDRTPPGQRVLAVVTPDPAP